jgi:CDP-diacylglycerol--serine O-phosphatidyltransferase
MQKDPFQTASTDSANRLREFPLARLFPNMITLAGLCCGLSSVRFAMLERWEMAVSFIVLAAILDGMDGRVARLLNSTSTFGAQLDSLSDFLCFGVCPVLVLYFWNLQDFRGVGWAVVLFFSICCALRLARFNTSLLDDKKAPWQFKFFVGVPAPAGALLCLIPMMLSFHLDYDFLYNQYILSAYAVVVAILMASRIPTFSAKHMRIPHWVVLPLMIGFGLWVAAMIIEPWITLAVTGLGYLLTFPFSITQHYRYRTGKKIQP